ncbi:MAG: hypothetical protein HOM00_05935 [Acidimicrobiaceae bacterium]|nr:hypothetical protein [Acidimicrobiaceae bacterium]
MNAGARSGGLGPSNAAAAPRAALLIGVAVAIGLLLLWKGLDDSPVAADRPAPAITDDVTDADPGTGTADPDVMTTEPVAGEPDDADAVAPTSAVPTTTAALFPTPTHDPNEVKVLVANGSGVSGAASKVTDMLSPLGWIMESPANADKTGTTRVYYRNGYQADARRIVEHFGEIPSLLEKMPTGGAGVPAKAEERVANAHIVVILGSDQRIQSN